MKVWLLLLFLALAGGLLTTALFSHRKHESWLAEHRGLRLGNIMYWLAAASLEVAERTRITDRLGEPISKVHHVLAGLYGAKTALSHTRWFIVVLIAFAWSCISLCALLGWLADGNGELPLYGLALASLSPFILYKREQSRLLQKQRAMLIELPEALNQLMLLVGAGETVQQAIVRIVSSPDKQGHPLYTELMEMAHALNVNASFTKAMEDFSKRCGMQETTLFTTTLLLNYKRGGDEMLISLRELSMTLWDKRKALARTLGEEASSKLVFPMVLIFFIVMIIVAVPALMMTGT